MIYIGAQRVRTALEREGTTITPSRPMPGVEASAVARPQRASHPVALTFRFSQPPTFAKDLMATLLYHVPN